ncbi:MAG: hypothetical protein V3U96_00705 [Paracoccaceae bacterium]
MNRFDVTKSILQTASEHPGFEHSAAPEVIGDIFDLAPPEQCETEPETAGAPPAELQVEMGFLEKFFMNLKLFFSNLFGGIGGSRSEEDETPQASDSEIDSTPQIAMSAPLGGKDHEDEDEDEDAPDDAGEDAPFEGGVTPTTGEEFLPLPYIIVEDFPSDYGDPEEEEDDLANCFM